MISVVDGFSSYYWRFPFLLQLLLFLLLVVKIKTHKRLNKTLFSTVLYCPIKKRSVEPFVCFDLLSER